MTQDSQENAGALVTIGQGPTTAMIVRMGEMKAQLDLIRTFFRTVMIEGEDYGLIPGTKAPTLLKPGAEKLCELYNFTMEIARVDRVDDRQTGFIEATVTVRLISSGGRFIEGVGEANSMEERYRNRWVPEWQMKRDHRPTEGLRWEERQNDRGTYKTYLTENEDPWSLWNTILKMAKKRAVVDATLSATRSSGIFTQDVEDLREWVIDAESSRDVTPPAKPPRGRDSAPPPRSNQGQGQGQARPPAQGRAKPAPKAPPADGSATQGEVTQFWGATRDMGLNTKDILRALGRPNIRGLSKADLDEVLERIVKVAGKDRFSEQDPQETIDSLMDQIAASYQEAETEEPQPAAAVSDGQESGS